jgi:hypothetical protein
MFTPLAEATYIPENTPCAAVLALILVKLIFFIVLPVMLDTGDEAAQKCIPAY